MTTNILSRSENTTEVIGILSALMVGVFLIYFAGISQAAVLHEAAHDQRHALAFPCH